MKKTLLITGALLALTASLASAAGGINLGWSDCYGVGGTSARSFACDTNTGANDLYVSVDPGIDIFDLVGSNPIVDLQSASTPLPAWWQFKNPGTCRQTSLSGIAAFPGSCVDVWVSQGVPGIAAYYTTAVLPSMPLNRARILCSISLPGSGFATVHPGTEYFCFMIRVNNAKSTGLGICAGCQDPVCLVLNEVTLGRANSPTVTLTSPLANNFCTWQGGGIGPPGCPGATPAINRTWGQLKSVYR